MYMLFFNILPGSVVPKKMPKKNSEIAETIKLVNFTGKKCALG